MEMTDRERFKLAFQDLRRKHRGFVARANFSCCGSCASFEIGEFLRAKGVTEENMHYCFWHRQSDDSFRDRRRRKGDNLVHDLYLHWSGDAAMIVEALVARGLNASHDGTKETCIKISPTLSH